MVIPDVGTTFFHAYRMKGPWGTLEADKGVLGSSDGTTRCLPAPILLDSTTISGDEWTLKVAPGWVIRDGAWRGDYEAAKKQP